MSSRRLPGKVLFKFEDGETVLWKVYSQMLKIKNIDKQTGYSIDRKLVDYIEWFSIYNMVPIGLVLKMVIGGTDKFFKAKDNSIKIKKTKKKLFNFKKTKGRTIANRSFRRRVY